MVKHSKVEGAKPSSPLLSFALMCAGWAVALMCSLPARAQPLVAVDAGHTLQAQGALSAIDGRSELLFNLDLSRGIADKLAQRGIKTRMANDAPRQRENFPQRASAGLGADLFLSVHHDSARPELLSRIGAGAQARYEDASGRFKGFSLFVDPADAKAVACARFVGQRLLEAGEQPSLYHATAEFGESRLFLDAQRGVHAFPKLALARLRKAPMVLLEAGVIINPAESARLREPLIRERLATAVASGVADCLKQASNL
jgi:N-acetylmuramoyl-L-alanine amidase